MLYTVIDPLHHPPRRLFRQPSQPPLVGRQRQAGDEALEGSAGLDRAQGLDGVDEGAALADEVAGEGQR